MAQILKHRRGDIGLLKNVTARKGELVIATGSIGNMAGPWIFIGETDGLAGAYRPVSKIYMGGTAPTISAGVYGTTLDGTPFYDNTNKTLYVLGSVANENLDITGNLENRTITGITITNLTSSHASFSTYVSASAVDVSGNAHVAGTLSGNTISGSNLHVTNNATIEGSLIVSGNVNMSQSLTINQNLLVTGSSTLLGDLLVSGNVSFLGSASYVHISSSVIELDDNIIKLNAYSPFERYAGFEVTDSGSLNTSASVLWDSENDYWMIVSSSGLSSRIIGVTAGTYGSEPSLTTGKIPISTGTSTLGDSLLQYTGTTLSFNVNKFTIDSNSGNTTIAGNLILTSVGGSDAGNKTSVVTFKNTSNEIGYVSTTETSDVIDGILGYRHSDGKLVFSLVIDGGEYTTV